MGAGDPDGKKRPGAEAELPSKILPGSPPGRKTEARGRRKGEGEGRIDDIPGTNHIPTEGAGGVGEGWGIRSMKESD